MYHQFKQDTGGYQIRIMIMIMITMNTIIIVLVVSVIVAGIQATTGKPPPLGKTGTILKARRCQP